MEYAKDGMAEFDYPTGRIATVYRAGTGAVTGFVSNVGADGWAVTKHGGQAFRYVTRLLKAIDDFEPAAA